MRRGATDAVATSASSHSQVPLLGLTGGIGAGKSAVADIFSALGVPVIDTDQLAHRLMAKDGRAVQAIRAQFGDGVMSVNGGVDRGHLRMRVFSDAEARLSLEQIMHPMIQEQVQSALLDQSLVPPTAPYAVLAVPLFFERLTYRRAVCRVLVVDCAVSTQIERVCRRPGLNESMARQIVQAQVPRSVRLQMADDVLMNDCAIGRLEAGVRALHQEYCWVLQQRGKDGPVCVAAGLGSECMGTSRQAAETLGTLPRP